MGQEEPIYKYNNQNTRHFTREACYAEKNWADVQEFTSSLCSESETFLQNLSKSNSKDICYSLQEYKKFIDVYKEEYRNKFDKATLDDEDYKLSIEKWKRGIC